MLRQILEAGVPAPEREYALIPGRRFRADFAWPRFRLALEVQGGIFRRGGGAHSRPGKILQDMEKQRLAVLYGWSIFPVTTNQVTSGEALTLLLEVLMARGVGPEIFDSPELTGTRARELLAAAELLISRCRSFRTRRPHERVRDQLREVLGE